MRGGNTTMSSLWEDEQGEVAGLLRRLRGLEGSRGYTLRLLGAELGVAPSAGVVSIELRKYVETRWWSHGEEEGKKGVEVEKRR